MREVTLRMFFTGHATAEELDADMEGTVRVRGPQAREVVVDPMTVDFDLEAAHLVLLCDAVIADRLEARHLNPIGFALICSDRFKGILIRPMASGSVRSDTTGRRPRSTTL